MKEADNAKKNPLFMPVALLLVVLVSYNLWSYLCGYCTMSSLMSFSPPAILLIAINLVAAAVLLMVRSRNKKLLQAQLCGCGTGLRTVWDYCPNCGQQRKRQT